MKTLAEKAVKAALLLSVPATFVIVAYLLYTQPKPEPSWNNDTFTHNDTSFRRHTDSIQSSQVQAAINKQLDSIALYPGGNVLTSLYNQYTSDSLHNDSLLSGHNSNSSVLDNKPGIAGNRTLQGPSALFTRTYSLTIGKPVPVNVLWAMDSVSSPTNHQLVTITLNDVTGNKAAFTLADSSAVLLYSEANYAENDKISIEDENHSLHISVLDVQPDSVKIQLMSFLNDGIVSKLKKME